MSSLDIYITCSNSLINRESAIPFLGYPKKYDLKKRHSLSHSSLLCLVGETSWMLLPEDAENTDGKGARESIIRPNMSMYKCYIALLVPLVKSCWFDSKCLQSWTPKNWQLKFIRSITVWFQQNYILGSGQLFAHICIFYSRKKKLLLTLL